GGPGDESQCRGDRQPDGEDDGKRGPRGFDGGKKITGRKRHIIVDTLGLLLALTVLPAHISDSAAGKPLIQQVVDEHDRLAKLWADQTYQGELVEWANGFERFELEIVKRPDEAKGFVLLPKRWIV